MNVIEDLDLKISGGNAPSIKGISGRRVCTTGR